MIDYAGLAAEAAALIALAGLPVKLSRQGAVVGSTSGVFSKARASLDGGMGGTQTVIHNLTMLLSAKGKEPKVGDLLLANKVEYVVSAVEPIRPALVTVAYRVELT